MARRFSFRPALTLKGRRFLGLRGFSGKPFHPPLTDVPIGAYVLAAVGDTLSWGWSDSSWAQEMFHAVTWVLVGGAIVGALASLTGIMDWWRSTTKGTQARRTANAHAVTMIAMSTLVAINILTRRSMWDDPATSTLLLGLSLVTALLMVIGATIGGSLVFDYGFNVKTAGDSPVWHESEVDLMPGQKPPPSG